MLYPIALGVPETVLYPSRVSIRKCSIIHTIRCVCIPDGEGVGSPGSGISRESSQETPSFFQLFRLR